MVDALLRVVSKSQLIYLLGRSAHSRNLSISSKGFMPQIRITLEVSYQTMVLLNDYFSFQCHPTLQTENQN